MESFTTRHKEFWSKKEIIISSLTALTFLVLSFFINYWAVTYAVREVGSGTTDILLNNLPVVNTNIIFSQGALLFIILIAVLVFLHPKKIPFVVNSIALFVCIRSVFVVMTHLGASPDHINTAFDRIKYISTSGADLFFSGHTGLPFLMALIFWQNKSLRVLFILCSIVAAVAVILGHLHYTIDVFSAFFITYGIYHIARIFFREDLKMFNEGVSLSEIVQ